MKKILAILLGVSVLASSCASSYQASGAMNGAMVGSTVGRAVGALSGRGCFHGRNAALGSLIGAGVGTILGVGITSAIEQKERRAYENQSSYEADNYAPAGGAYDHQYNTPSRPNTVYSGAHGGAYNTLDVAISELTYTDANGDGCISKGETIEVQTFITNTTNTVLRDIVLSLNVSDPNNLRVSPSLTTTLRPGQRIRYTGRVYCTRARNGRWSNIHLTATCNGRSVVSEVIAVQGRR